MRITFPKMPGGPLGQTLEQSFDNIKTVLASGVSKDEAVNRILLLAPDQSCFAISVTTTGALTTTLITGKIRDI